MLSPICLEAVQRIDALFDIERDINGHDAELRRTTRQALSAPLVTELHGWLSAHRTRLARGNDVARAIDYLLKRWTAFIRFLDDGRICISNNAAERALRGIAMTRSLYPSFSSGWKDWKFVLPSVPTRAVSRCDSLCNARVVQVGSLNLPGSIRNHLLGRQGSFSDEAADYVRANAKRCRGFRHGQPLAGFFGRAVGVDAMDAADGVDAVRRPGFALAGAHAHAVERGRDLLVGPASGHAADYRQRLLGRACGSRARRCGAF